MLTLVNQRNQNGADWKHEQQKSWANFHSSHWTHDTWHMHSFDVHACKRLNWFKLQGSERLEVTLAFCVTDVKDHRAASS